MPSWSTIARRVRVPLGFAFAAVYLWLARPTGISIAAGAFVALLGLLLRGYASGHLRKNEQLATSGPYAFTRNPLYLGSLIIAAGFTVAGLNWWIALIAAILFVAIYIPVMRSEETFLRNHFPEFAVYFNHVPQLIPRLSPYQSSSTGFSAHLYWKHREYNAAIGAVLMFAALLTKMIWFSR